MMKEMKIGTYTYNDEDINFNFVTDLTVAEKLKFVNSVTDLVVSENRYNSIIKDLVFDFYIIDIMTDVETSKLKKSLTFLADVEDFLLSTNIVDIVKANAFPNLFNELNIAVDKSVAYLTGIHLNPFSESLASLISAIEKKVNEVDLSSMAEMVQKFAGMTDELTPENIMNAYMNSDIYNKNLAEIEDAKSKRAEFAKDMDKAIKLVTEKK